MHIPSYKRCSTSLLYYHGLIDRPIESPVEVDIITGVELEVRVVIVPTGVNTNSMIRGIVLIITVYCYLS